MNNPELADIIGGITRCIEQLHDDITSVTLTKYSGLLTYEIKAELTDDGRTLHIEIQTS
jgi:hypothetical protein